MKFGNFFKRKKKAEEPKERKKKLKKAQKAKKKVKKKAIEPRKKPAKATAVQEINRNECPECGSINVVISQITGNTICQDCGAILAGLTPDLTKK